MPVLQKEEKLEVRNIHLKLIYCGKNISVCVFFGGLECVGRSFAYVAHLIFFRYVWFEPRELP